MRTKLVLHSEESNRREHEGRYVFAQVPGPSAWACSSGRRGWLRDSPCDAECVCSRTRSCIAQDGGSKRGAQQNGLRADRETSFAQRGQHFFVQGCADPESIRRNARGSILSTILWEAFRSRS